MISEDGAISNGGEFIDKNYEKFYEYDYQQKYIALPAPTETIKRFKTVDIGVDLLRIIHEPSVVNAKKFIAHRVQSYHIVYPELSKLTTIFTIIDIKEKLEEGINHALTSLAFVSMP